MKNALIIALIFLPLRTLSQKVIINPSAETVTLDKQKTIDVAKIIQNEQRLYEQVQFLEQELERLNDSINAAVNNYEEALTAITELQRQINGKQTEINEITETQYKAEQKLRKGGLFGFATAGVQDSQLQTLTVGLNYTRPKMQYYFGVEPVLTNRLVFVGGIGIRIF